ncbi:hypothetical protein [Caulobacter sp. DWP3-1-3b2]|uniref:hypothetical protein n=1 Tax=Caulobacter sp. DWP3-1-3b2 TaxID=2804643 RepID=UPI003CF1C1B1
MKKLFGVLLMAAAIGAVSSPALAHPDDDDNDNDNDAYSQYLGGYQNFDALYRHDIEGIQHSLSDGSYSRSEARDFVVQLRGIRQREAYFRSRDGWLSPQEGRDIQLRLKRLHEVMHEAHEDGHIAQDDWNENGSAYRRYNGYDQGSGYGGYYRRH